MTTHIGRSNATSRGQRRLVVDIRSQSTDEEDLVETRDRLGQQRLDVADRLVANPQHPTTDRALLEKELPPGDGGDRRPEQCALAVLLRPAEQRHPAPVSNRPCDRRRPVASGRPHVRVVQPYDSVGQHPEVVVTTESIARTGRIRAVGTVAFAHRPVRSRRPEPARGQVLMHSSISSSSQPTAGAPMRAARGNLPSSMWTTIVERHIPVRSFATGNRQIRVAIGGSSGTEDSSSRRSVATRCRHARPARSAATPAFQKAG